MLKQPNHSAPVIFILFVNLILKRMKIIKNNKRLIALTMIPVLSVYVYNYFYVILASDLTIYHNVWNRVRDYFIIPILVISTVWLVTFFILRKKEAGANEKHV